MTDTPPTGEMTRAEYARELGGLPMLGHKNIEIKLRLLAHDATLRAERDKYKKEALIKFDCQVCSGALEAENERLIKERDALNGHLDAIRKELGVSEASSRPLACYVTDLTRKLADLSEKYKVLVAFYDKHVGTPCEEIRHKQEVEALQEKLAESEKAAYDVNNTIEHLKEKLAESEQARQELKGIITWLLGENGQFPTRPEKQEGKIQPLYWWRTELQRRYRLALEDHHEPN